MQFQNLLWCLFYDLLHYLLSFRLGGAVNARWGRGWLNHLSNHVAVFRAAPGSPRSAKYIRLFSVIGFNVAEQVRPEIEFLSSDYAGVVATAVIPFLSETQNITSSLGDIFNISALCFLCKIISVFGLNQLLLPLPISCFPSTSLINAGNSCIYKLASSALLLCTVLHWTEIIEEKICSAPPLVHSSADLLNVSNITNSVGVKFFGLV